MAASVLRDQLSLLQEDPAHQQHRTHKERRRSGHKRPSEEEAPQQEGGVGRAVRFLRKRARLERRAATLPTHKTRLRKVW